MSDRTAVPLVEAATLLGTTTDALRKRVKRGRLEGFVGNDGRLRVYIDADLSARRPDDGRGPSVDAGKPSPDVSGQLAEMTARAAVAEAERDAERRRVEELRAAFREHVEDLRARLAREDARREATEARQVEQDRRLDDVLRQLGELRDERQRRRPWPGLIAWARRIVYGDDRGTGGAT